MIAPATLDSCAHRERAVGVWDQLWSYQPTDVRDDELLTRERASKRWRITLERLKRTFGEVKGLRTIELGSGRGDLSVLLAQAGASVTLLDSSQRALDQARARFDRLGLTARFQIGDLFAADAEDREFDVALSSGVIEHFRDKQRTAAIQAHRAVIHKNGMVVISVPNAGCPPYRIWKAWLTLRGSWPYGYEAPYSRHEIARRARESGFDRIEVRGCGFRQALDDQLMPLLGKRRGGKCHSDSMFDDSMGLALILFGWKS